MHISATMQEPQALARGFCAELTPLPAMGTVVRDRADCAAAIAEYLRSRNVRRIAVQTSPLAQQVAALVEGFERSPAIELSRDSLEQVDCGVLEARSLLADTGSAIVMLDSAQDRVLPYLPRTCVIVADMASLHPTMTPDALACINDPAGAGARGEALIITGPSKSADIEKTLVLGAHGPEALAVFIMERP
jgi:L-lactate dehydrogenase complex protein LldG